MSFCSSIASGGSDERCFYSSLQIYSIWSAVQLYGRIANLIPLSFSYTKGLFSFYPRNV